MFPIRIKYYVLCGSILGLSACGGMYQTSSQPDYKPYAYDDRVYPQYEALPYPPLESKEVVVPETYHMSSMHAPIPHSDRDKTWVNSQSSNGYTIELADDEKASNVANTLYKAPKKERMAEVRYQKEGKTYYKGLYGSYPSYEAAQQALKDLPEDMRQHAGIKTWGSVQGNVQE